MTSWPGHCCKVEVTLSLNKHFQLILFSTGFQFHAFICPLVATVATLSFLTGCAAALNNILHLSRGLNGGNFLSGRNLLTAGGMNITSLPLLLLLQLPNVLTIKVRSFTFVFKSFCCVCKAIFSHRKVNILAFDGVATAQKLGKCPKSVHISLDGGRAL